MSRPSVLLILLLLATPVAAGERFTMQIAGLTERCGSQWEAPEVWASQSWRNPFGQAIYMREARVWIGFDHGRVADVAVQLVRERDGNLLVSAPFDRYAEPSQPIIVASTFAPDYVEVRPDDVLVLRLACVWWIGEESPTSAAAAYISFTREKP